MIKHRDYNFTVFVVMSLLLSACVSSTQNVIELPVIPAPFVSIASSEELLDAEGRYPLVEVEAEGITFPKGLISSKSSEGYDPSFAHMQAREKLASVGISQSTTRYYTSRPRAKDMAENIHMRVLRVDMDAKAIVPLPPLKVKSEQKPAQGTDHGKGADVFYIQPAAGSLPFLSRFKSTPNLIAQIKPSTVTEIAEFQGVANNNIVMVMNVRVGEHEGKTRFVLDLTGQQEFRSAIVSEGKKLVLEITGANWKTTSDKVFFEHPLVESYSAREHKDGRVTFVLALKEPSELVLSKLLQPSGSGTSHRIVLDVRKIQ